MLDHAGQESGVQQKYPNGLEGFTLGLKTPWLQSSTTVKRAKYRTFSFLKHHDLSGFRSLSRPQQKEMSDFLM